MSQAPPPDPIPAAPSASSFSVGEAVGYGWNAYWQNVGPMLVITIVIIVIQAVFGVLSSTVDSAIVRALANLVGWIVGMVLALGLYRASLAVVRGETPEVGMLFRFEGLGSYFVASILYGLMVAVGLILLIVPGIILAIMFMFYGYLIVEDPALGPIEALSKAREITRGKLGELFVFGLALLGINLVGAILCGIGLLFTYGITSIAVAYAYRRLNNEPVAQLA